MSDIDLTSLKFSPVKDSFTEIDTGNNSKKLSDGNVIAATTDGVKTVYVVKDATGEMLKAISLELGQTADKQTYICYIDQSGSYVCVKVKSGTPITVQSL